MEYTRIGIAIIIILLSAVLFYLLLNRALIKKYHKVEKRLIEREIAINFHSLRQFYSYKDHYRVVYLTLNNREATEEFYELIKLRNEHLDDKDAEKAKELDIYIEDYVKLKV